MDKKLKAKWLKALRGGRYKQGGKALKSQGAYCCLGVLANVQGCSWRPSPFVPKMTPFMGDSRASSDDAQMGYLRPKFAGGITRKTQKKLANMNDHGSTFKEIADYIEKRL